MASMVVTLDVSRLSGWLNADAYCRVERGRAWREGAACGAGGGWEGVGGSGGGASSVQGGSQLRRVAGQGGACVERTVNMSNMVVTLDVSKLSGWLNADADCRVKREAWERQQHGNKGGRRCRAK